MRAGWKASIRSADSLFLYKTFGRDLGRECKLAGNAIRICPHRWPTQTLRDAVQRRSQHRARTDRGTGFDVQDHEVPMQESQAKAFAFHLLTKVLPVLCTFDDRPKEAAQSVSVSTSGDTGSRRCWAIRPEFKVIYCHSSLLSGYARANQTETAVFGHFPGRIFFHSGHGQKATGTPLGSFAKKGPDKSGPCWKTNHFVREKYPRDAGIRRQPRGYGGACVRQ